MAPLRHNFNVYQYIPAPLAISSNYTNVVTIHPSRSYYFESADEKHSMYLSKADISNCAATGRMLLCSGNPILRRRSAPDCVAAIYQDHHNDILAQCLVNSVPPVPNAWTLTTDSWAVFFPHPASLTVTCASARSQNEKRYQEQFQGLRLLTLPKDCRAFTPDYVIQRFGVLTDEQTLVALDATIVTDILSQQADQEHLNEFEDKLTAAVPQKYHDPALVRVRHSPPTPLWVKILAGLGVGALGGLFALCAILFCRFRQTTIQVNTGTKTQKASDNNYEMAPLNQAE